MMLSAQELWVVDFLREHGYPFSDYDASGVENVFVEFFTEHIASFDETVFRAACVAAVDEACDAWEARTKLYRS